MQHHNNKIDDRGDINASRDDVPTVTELTGAIDTFDKPRLRGWLHAGAALTSVATGVVLVSIAGVFVSTRAAWSTAVYAVTILALFSISAAYHRLNWSPRGAAAMKRLDHCMIFIFIAGTYTPLAVLALPRSSGHILLVVVWSGAAAGVALKMIWPHAPRWLGVPLYIGLGWAAVFVLPDIGHRAGAAVLTLIIIGGVAYSLGGLIYATKRPTLYPTTFGFHEAFHATTIIAATCHYVAIWLILF